MNVAQLKQVVDAPVRPVVSVFPRLNERGSIEAYIVQGGAELYDSFPRLNERGSIEA